MAKRATRYHIMLITLTLVLLQIIGLANLYSAGAETYFFDTQLKHTFLGLFAFFLFGWLVPIRWVNTYSYLFFLGITFFLALVLFLGHAAGGAQRWVYLGPVRFQPSEIAKLAVVLLVSKFVYNSNVSHSFSIRELSPLLIALTLIFVLIFKQPDFGTAGTCVLIAFAQLVFIRIRVNFRTIVSLAAVSMVGAVLGWQFFLRPYQKLRILNLLNPNMDPSGSGYNSLQSLIAIGSGKQFGKGFLQGTQTQLQFLPARHTDFIFSVFAEEHGFWGCMLVFFLFTAIAYIALEIARDSRDIFCSLVAVGVAALVFIEFTINVAMVLGLFPVVGMPLPFFSYGGSALLTTCLALGLLIAIERDTYRGASGNRYQ